MTKVEKYTEALTHIKGLIQDETDVTANLANITAVLHNAFSFWWVGFYLVKGNELVLGPFQGPVACTRIGAGKGVCGTSWQQGKTIVVPNVHEFPGHIACSAASNSEIVVPIFKNQQVAMVLDVDSTAYDHFDETDQKYLEQIAVMVSTFI